MVEATGRPIQGTEGRLHSDPYYFNFTWSASKNLSPRTGKIELKVGDPLALVLKGLRTLMTIPLDSLRDLLT